MYNGDCIIFVSEKTESLCVRPVSLTDDESKEHYIREMVSMSQIDAPQGTIHVERIDLSLLEEWKRQLGSQNIEKGLHIFQYIQGNLMVITRDGIASLTKDI